MPEQLSQLSLLNSIQHFLGNSPPIAPFPLRINLPAEFVVTKLLPVSVAIGLIFGIIAYLPSIKFDADLVDLEFSRRFEIGSGIFLGYFYSLFRFGANNRGISYFTAVLLVLGVAILLKIPDENNLFTFVYATLLFFQVLVTRDLHLISIGEIDRLTQEEKDAIIKESYDGDTFLKVSLENVGTIPANNIRVKYRIYGPTGELIEGPKIAEINDDARSIEPGGRTTPTDVLMAYEIPDNLTNSHYVLQTTAKTGEGSSLLQDTDWRQLPA